MKKIAIFTISAYQIFISTILKSILGTNKFCRFEESCSAYAKRTIIEKGLLKGFWLSLIRLAKCQPLYKGSLRLEAKT